MKRKAGAPRQRSKNSPARAPDIAPGSEQFLQALELVKRELARDKDYWMPYWNRIASVAIQSGANTFDVAVIVGELASRSSSIEDLARLIPHAFTRLRMIQSLSNKKSRVTQEHRAAVHEARERLASSYAQKTPLYRAIATELGLKLDRVRYILEGERRSGSSR